MTFGLDSSFSEFGSRQRSREPVFENHQHGPKIFKRDRPRGGCRTGA
jgi:hypothetical protein